MLVTVTGCVADPGFRCVSGDQCVGGEQGSGTCESTGYCSFADPICNGSKRRYADSAAEWSGQCVAACQPETDIAFCSAAMKTCGSYTGVDNCGAQRTANCGLCPLIQTGAVTTGNSTLTMSLPAVSTAGTLLVATLTFDKAADPSGPGGWLRWSAYSSSNDGELWFYANNPGGLTSATFTLAGATTSVGQISEFNFSTYDVGNYCWQSNSVTSLSCMAMSPTTHGGELAVSIFSEIVGTAAPLTLNASAGWTVLGDNQSASTKLHYIASYMLNVPNGSSVSETITTTSSGIWASALTTFY
jgi:hypothetical protein